MPKTTPRTKKSPMGDTPSSPPPLTDPHLAALLMYITGLDADDPDDDTHELAQIAHDARCILDAPDASAIFDGRLGHTDIHECVHTALRRDYANDDDSYAAKHRAIVRGILDRPDDTLTAHAEYVSNVLDGAIADAFSRGAAVMYLVLKGVVR